MTSQSPVDALSVSGLTVTIQQASQQLRVVDGISFNLRSGEVLALVGESGCGKTKTAEAIMGLVPRDSGVVQAASIRIGDTELAVMPEAVMRQIRGREISMIFQEPMTALDPVFSIGSQMSSVFRRHRKLSKALARRSSLEMLARVGFPDTARVMRSYPHELSGGMRQRVMIGMAMACDPRVIIADEPTTALDVTTQAQVLARLTDLGRQTGTSILLITHDLGIVAQYCDRALVMSKGKIIEEAEVKELFARPAHPYTRSLLAAAAGAND